MNAKTANSIPIQQYLEYRGIIPTKHFNGYLMYKSLTREEKTASMKVDTSLNLWVDFGASNSGGTLVDLVLSLNPKFSISDALNNISETIKEIDLRSFSFQKQEKKVPAISSIEIIAVEPIIHNLKLCEYIKQREIDFMLANQFVKSVKYRYKEWVFYAIGNRNEKGWSLRSPKFKGCTAQSYSLYTNNSTKVCVFEGIFDFLSFITINHNTVMMSDYIILNSIVNINSCIEILRRYNDVQLYLDNDFSGRNTTKLIVEKIGKKTVTNNSSQYKLYKDFNEYHIERAKCMSKHFSNY